ncbi:MAG: 16S rRNA (guanine(527)-N(7))-methyltransferase RsmG [Sulfurimonadaceae bacterium]|nr:16S rRNA (guanine(527)-N(7))-methyltransferase RsmG [Arcobacteraceae bacterium]
MNEIHIKKFEELNIELDSLFYERCEQFIALLQQWGRVHNFTAELKEEQIIDNILDSLYPLKFVKPFDSFADIGTGAGYPGMILAMARPQIKGCLIESRSKRVAFLNFVKNSLKLENLEIICNRVENVKHHTSFDLITSRAVTNTSLLLQLTHNISNEKTRYLFYKGSHLEAELQDVCVQEFEVITIKERNYLYINHKGTL